MTTVLNPSSIRDDTNKLEGTLIKSGFALLANLLFSGKRNKRNWACRWKRDIDTPPETRATVGTGLERRHPEQIRMQNPDHPEHDHAQRDR